MSCSKKVRIVNISKVVSLSSLWSLLVCIIALEGRIYCDQMDMGRVFIPSNYKQIRIFMQVMASLHCSMRDECIQLTNA